MQITMAWNWKSLRMLVEIIALIQLRSVLAGDENISFKQSLELLREFCKTCTEPMNKECKKCSTVLKECDPNNGSAPYLGEVWYNVNFNKNLANITWDQINVTGVRGAANWTGYYLMWYISHPQTKGDENFTFKGNCLKFSKTQPRFAVVTLDHEWRLPDSLIVYVTTAPMPNYRDYTMYEFFPTKREITVPLPSPPPPRLPVVSIIGGCTAGFLLVLVLGGVLGYRKWRSQSGRPSQHGFDYDVFISYSRQDDTFLQKTILTLLDEHNVKYCIDFKDWVAGNPWQENLVYSIRKSRKVLFIASSSFLNRKNCQKEIDQALYWNGDHSNIIVLRIDSFDKDLLPRTLRGRTFIDYSSKLERLTWQGRLIKALKASSMDIVNTLSTQQTYHALPRNC